MRNMNKEKELEFLNYKPIVSHNNYYFDDDNIVIVINRKDKWSLFINWLMKSERKKFIHLDDLGSTLWILSNGDNTVEDIIQKMCKKFPDKYESMKSRVSKFISHLYKEKLITLKEK